MEFSIILPAYNVEKYLEKMVNSLMKQTIEPYEIIIVEDCSKDKTRIICEMLEKKYSKIRVVYLEKNGGLSNARNKGFEQVTGEYVLFLDSDDYVENTLLEEIEKSLLKRKADVVVFGLREEYMNSKNEIHFQKIIVPCKKNLNQIELRRQVIDLEEQTLFGYVWNKAYKVSYLKENMFKFKTIKMIEDVLYNIDVFENVQSCNLIDKDLYHYVIKNSGSLTKDVIDDFFELSWARVEQVKKLYIKWNMYDEAVKKKLDNILVRYFFASINRNKEKGLSNKQQFLWMKKCLQEPKYQTMLRNAEPDSFILKIMAYATKNKKIYLCWLIADAIYIVKKYFPRGFVRLKQLRR